MRIPHPAAWLIVLCLIGIGSLKAAPINLKPVSATTGPDSHLAEAVDGIEKPENGWIVPQATTQSGIFRCVPTLDAGRLRFRLKFGSSRPKSYFGEFSISVTTDANPSANSPWETLFPTGFAASEGWMKRAYPRLRMGGVPAKTNVQVDALLSLDHVTAIRIVVWPSPGTAAGDAVLTELELQRTPLESTNVAVGCPVTASGPLGDNYAEFLTDGLAGSFAGPSEEHPEQEFYFEIDLRRVRQLDHITVRGRAEAIAMNRASDLHFELFDEKPGFDTPPIWIGQTRGDDKTPEVGAGEVVHGSDGNGLFRGRYLRISSMSHAPLSPEIAEVEVYESIVPSGVEVRANDRLLPPQKKVRIPSDTKWLTFTLTPALSYGGTKTGRRWRIVGSNDTWQAAGRSGVMESRGLPPGEYYLEVQFRHPDHVWNTATLRVPFVVVTPWWKHPAAQFAAALAVTGLAALLAWYLTRRRMAQRLAEIERRQELSRERARIARDMHDVVGARLTQLAMMQEIFAVEHPQSTEAKSQLAQLNSVARETVSAMDEAVWAVNPRNDTLQNVANYLGHTATEYLTPLKIAGRWDVAREWPAIEVVSQKRHQLLLAFKEALQNIAKHAAASEVTIAMHYEEGKFRVRIEDNGRGLPADFAGPEKDGVGNMATRLASIGGTCEVRSRPDGGTLVEMQVSL